MNSNIRIGILCPSEIAFRRFLPSLKATEGIHFSGLAIANEQEWEGILTEDLKDIEYQKAEKFINQYGGMIYKSYKELIVSTDIDAVYIPLPPALHYKWAKLALENDKHVFVEKPSTTKLQHTEELISLAKEKNLVIHENYMFQYHSQIEEIYKIINSNELGNIHSYHSRFGFPLRSKNDFRYNHSLGGGALLDAGGYVVKLATLLLGPTIELVSSRLVSENGFEVDMYGTVIFKNINDQIFIGEFGMNCEYQCNLSIWGSKGILQTNRIFTAPDNFIPSIEIIKNSEIKTRELLTDYSFQKSIQCFIQAINNDILKNQLYKDMITQSRFIEKIKKG